LFKAKSFCKACETNGKAKPNGWLFPVFAISEKKSGCESQTVMPLFCCQLYF
jgi:hypothetical protein